MEDKVKFGIPEYYKIMLVSINPDRCRVLKGPEEEKRLAEILRDDFDTGRYEKMLQLLVWEMVDESERENVFRLLSPGHLQQELSSGAAMVSCSYLRNVDGKMQQVSTRVFPRRFTERGKVEEFMIYVSVAGN